MSENEPISSSVRWRRSSICATGACVEVAFDADTVYVRDSKDPDGPRLRFDAAEWNAFRQGIVAGELAFGLG